MNIKITFPDSLVYLLSFIFGWVTIGYISGGNHNVFVAFVIYSVLYTVFDIVWGIKIQNRDIEE